MTSNYYSGFCLKNEKELFDEVLEDGDFVLQGFSYGAIKAFKEALNSTKRVDKLQLISPAFFQTQDKKFKRMQLMFFKKDAKSYCDSFLENIAYPSTLDTNKYFIQGSQEELDELINYTWSEDELQALVDKGTKVEVYLGVDDKIIDSEKAKDFFVKYATVYYMKNVGHILKA